MARPKLNMNQHMERISNYDRASNNATRKVQRSLSLAVREGFDPDWYKEWKLLVLQGKRPILVKDDRCYMGYRVDVNKGASTPTYEEQDKALKELMDRGFGMPVQQLLLDAELRGQIASYHAELDLQQLSGALSLQQREQILRALGPAALIGPGESSTHSVNVKEPAAVIDAESQESSED